MAWWWPCSAPVFQVGLHLVVVAGKIEFKDFTLPYKNQPTRKAGAHLISPALQLPDATAMMQMRMAKRSGRRVKGCTNFP